MCGIGGIVRKKESSFSLVDLPALGQAISHRGPDDHGYLVWEKNKIPSISREFKNYPQATVGLVHRRLSIIDATQAGWQPMSSPDGRYHIVYNGEFYNYLEIKKELQTLGHVFKTRCDTEVLLTSFVQWGKDMLQKIVGMFSFAILDVKKSTLLIVRDFFGIKPLYYTFVSGAFIFASEIKALLQFPCVSRCVDPALCLDYLQFGRCSYEGQTLFKAIKQLPAAHWMEINIESLETDGPVRYWSISRGRKRDLQDPETKNTLREIFLESMALHVRSDVPIGAALSGGIDSSSIVMAMRYLSGNDLDLRTFTYVSDNEALNEGPYAHLLAEAAGSKMRNIHLSPQNLIEDLDRLIIAQEQPFGSTSIYAQYKVFQEAQKAGVKVMLDGQGADEMLAGYWGYLTPYLVSLMKQGSFKKVMRFLRSSSYKANFNLQEGLKLGAGLLPQQIISVLFHWGQYFSRYPSWINAAWCLKRDTSCFRSSSLAGLRSLDESLYLSFTNTSLPSLLRYEDINSMAHSIESRVPFLTPQLVNFIFSLPESELIHPNGATKSIFRMAMRGLVPDKILDRQDKIGFQTPEKDWLKELSPVLLKVIDSDFARSLPIIRSQEMVKEFQNSIASHKKCDWKFWRWVNFIKWAEFMDVSFEHS